MAINSTEWAWSDMQISLNGVALGKISKMTVKTERESEHLYGAGDDPFAINTGNKSYNGELETFGTVIANMNRAAKAAGYDDLTDVPWAISVSFKATRTEPMQTILVPNVVFGEFEEGGENNDKAFKKTLPFQCLKPRRS